MGTEISETGRRMKQGGNRDKWRSVGDVMEIEQT